MPKTYRIVSTKAGVKGRRRYAHNYQKVPKRRRKTRPVNKSGPLVKRTKFVGYDNVALFGTSGVGESGDPIECHLIRPLNLNRVSNATPDDNARQSNTIFARNARCKFECFPVNTYIQPFQIRVAYGYFNGDAGVGTQQLTSAQVKAIYPDINDNLYDQDNEQKKDFKWIYSRTYTMSPKQIWDSDPDDTAEAGSLRANWFPKRFYINFKFNKRHSYANSDGDSLDGGCPIIMLQVKPLPGGNGFTRPTVPAGGNTGAYPCPRFHINNTTFFSDIK